MIKKNASKTLRQYSLEELELLKGGIIKLIVERYLMESYTDSILPDILQYTKLMNNTSQDIVKQDIQHLLLDKLTYTDKSKGIKIKDVKKLISQYDYSLSEIDIIRCVLDVFNIKNKVSYSEDSMYKGIRRFKTFAGLDFKS